MDMHRRYSKTALALTVLATLACNDAPISPLTHLGPSFSHKPGHGGGGPPGGGGDPATADYRDASGDALRSDLGGTYADGTDETSVDISETDFHFNVDDGVRGNKVRPNRDFVLDLGTPTDPSFPSDPFGETTLETAFFRVHTGLVADGNGDPILCGGAPVSAPARLLFPAPSGEQAHLSFDAPNVGFGDPVSITRVDNGDGLSRWTITSSGEGYLRLNNVYAGTFLMPFELTVVGEPGC